MPTEEMQFKALRLVEVGLVRQVNGPLWEVTSLNSDYIYDVHFQSCGGTCTCRGFKFRGWCYHMEAVAMSQPKPISQSVRIEEELL